MQVQRIQKEKTGCNCPGNEWAFSVHSLWELSDWPEQGIVGLTSGKSIKLQLYAENVQLYANERKKKHEGSHKFSNLLISTGVPVESVLQSQTILRHLLKMINQANYLIRIKVFFMTDVSVICGVFLT